MPGFHINGTGSPVGNHPDGRGEVRRPYRWVFRLLTSLPNRDALLYLRSCNRPQLTLEPIEQHHNQERIYHAGRTEWNELTMTWYDMETPVDVSQAVYDWLEQAVYSIDNAEVNHPETYKQTAELSMTSHNGNTNETWKLYNSWPTTINWNELDYSNNDVMELEATVRYDRASRQ